MSRIERQSFTSASEQRGARITVAMQAEDLALFYSLLKKWKPSGEVEAVLKQVLLKNICEALSVDDAFIP